MECQSCSEALTALIDGELSSDESLSIREHLSKCLTCQSEYDSLFESLKMVESLTSLEPEDRLWARITSDISVSPTSQNWVRSLLDQLFARRWVPVSALGAIVILVMALVLWKPADPVQDEFSHFMQHREAIYNQQREILFNPDEVYRDRVARNPFAQRVSATDPNPFRSDVR